MSNHEGDVFNEIVRTVHGNTDKAINGAMFETGTVLGTLTATGLKLDNFDKEYKDYLVLDYLKLNDSYYTEATTCTASHRHEFKTPEHIKKLEVGDRVLVAQFGADNVIIGRVVPHG
ncbi:hypothetical protein CLPUN_46290 [Clostridium puniceum]|uniref:Uncharacterized protein n=1 Tax=Clostridium puniceum TaxID=29367 RepID=A0A1S8T574_9CLOT|nr:hypothetical protein [Clostridium puniceum]OOM72926.1 hypothetical protein CLPUN_46290 [Clostridium puniceum]